MATTPLVRDLQRAVGAEHVLYAPEDLIAYEYDATIDRARPDVVVFPVTTEEVAAAVRIAAEYDQPVTPRGSGTGLSGGALPVLGGLLIVMTRMNRIIEVDPQNRIAVVQPGVINLALQEVVARDGLIYAPDPSSQRVCTLGGNVANNSGGPHTLAHGSTVNHVLGLELVLPDGRVTRVGGRLLDVPGVDLRGLLVGSEGTLGIVTEITVRLVPIAPSVRTLLGIFDSVADASEAVSAVIRRGIIPVAMEMLDHEIIQIVEPRIHAGYPLDAGAVLLIEVDGLREAVDEQAAAIREVCDSQGAREVREAKEQAERERL